MEKNQKGDRGREIERKIYFVASYLSPLTFFDLSP
jgi:hypothetical protein